jgi:hypothetical protein
LGTFGAVGAGPLVVVVVSTGVAGAETDVVVVTGARSRVPPPQLPVTPTTMRTTNRHLAAVAFVPFTAIGTIV